MSHPLIPGNNGVIDGQGSVWWQWLRSHKLNHSRPHILEFLHSEEIVISNLTFLNSPAWSIHPVYCRCNAINLASCVSCGLVNVSCICTNAYCFCFFSNVKIHNVTIKTALDAPLTDGIVPGMNFPLFLTHCLCIFFSSDIIDISSHFCW
jgi:polygalacturonase